MRTAKSVEHVLQWIDTHQHHYASWVDEQGYFVLKGSNASMRIPEALQAQARPFVVPAMTARNLFALNRKGRALLKKTETHQ